MEEDFDTLFKDCESIVSVLGQLAGFASGCWYTAPVEEEVEDATPALERIFDSKRAENAVIAADNRIKEIINEARAKEYQAFTPEQETPEPPAEQ